jgi:hypothetical protein
MQPSRVSAGSLWPLNQGPRTGANERTALRPSPRSGAFPYTRKPDGLRRICVNLSQFTHNILDGRLSAPQDIIEDWAGIRTISAENVLRLALMGLTPWAKFYRPPGCPLPRQVSPGRRLPSIAQKWATLHTPEGGPGS